MNPKYQIFISSTYVDLKAERDQVVKAILEMGHIPVGMEMFSAGDESQWQVIARTIEQSDYYVVVVAHRYGSLDEICSSWESKADLAGKVSVALTKQFVVSPRPGWVRASEAVTPQMANEMSRLSQENAQLREQLAETARAGDAVKTDWKSYFDHCVDIAGAASRLKLAEHVKRSAPSPQHVEEVSAAKVRLGDAAQNARKALGRLKLEKNPVSPEAMVKAAQLIGELQSGKVLDLEGLRAEVAEALTSVSRTTPAKS
jgi:hypothetical protein